LDSTVRIVYVFKLATLDVPQPLPILEERWGIVVLEILLEAYITMAEHTLAVSHLEKKSF